ncbi:hypothetical protein BROUX41_000718 [Berkeleyomyces rouxiae]|uniref:uncharacterized protein n=1 Tax=Berkeleyomyces rouxiae TaxID=2035830 RepID=UPI003B7F6E8D
MAPQDSFIDEEEDTCPLCIEEFDLSDRSFHPCPCGYQVCQFCFNNIRNNMNGLCPACRRPYDDKTIKYKLVTQEEEALFKANITKSQKRRVHEQRQRESQKREAEKESRRSLVGVRVVQKNLVYVTGLTPTVREDELLKTLRKPEFFGQYGAIQKISISNRKTSDGQNQSLGIYVTFEKPEEANRCINAVNGSHNGDRVLKAQLGTTKYCSAWLRYEPCTNRVCMFLHEKGDEEDSYTRQDLSSMNSLHTQRPFTNTTSGSSSSGTGSRSTPVMRTLQSLSASQPMARTSSKDGGADHGSDGSALPLTANWARNQQRSPRGNHATTTSSPALATSLPATSEDQPQQIEKSTNVDGPPPTGTTVVSATPDKGKGKSAVQPSPTAASSSNTSAQESPDQTGLPPPPASPPKPIEEVQPEAPAPPSAKAENEEMKARIRIVKDLDASWSFKELSAQDFTGLEMHPPMFDSRGGEKRQRMREVEETRNTIVQEPPVVEAQETTEAEPESSGSHALGGEPEDGETLRDGYSQRQASNQAIRSETQFGSAIGSNFGVQSSTPVGVVGGRSLTPQQQLFIRSQSALSDQSASGLANAGSMFPLPSHNRQSSRLNFGADSNTSQLATNPRLLAQRSIAQQTAFQHQNSPYYPASVSGPPPGLKSTATPPNMFGQGPAFGNSGFAAPRETNDVLLQTILRDRTNNQAQAQAQAQAQVQAGKREYLTSLFSNQYPPTSLSITPTSTLPLSSITAPASASASGLLASLYGNQQHQQQIGASAGFQDFGPKQQKKKGKKHRHANTSSSGGSGLVDLADPSILQARMQQHQTQSNAGVGVGGIGSAGVGQGIFSSGQNQGTYNPNMVYNTGYGTRW